MKKYFFPLNFDYLTKLFGFFEYKLLLPLGIFAAILIFFISLFNFSILTNIGIFISVFLPIFLLFNTSVNHEPFYVFLYCLISHHNTTHKYIIK